MEENMKKKYTKPEVFEVELTVMNPILGECDSTGNTSDTVDCITTGCLSP